jgi:hypothetical protein
MEALLRRRFGISEKSPNGLTSTFQIRVTFDFIVGFRRWFSQILLNQMDADEVCRLNDRRAEGHSNT